MKAQRISNKLILTFILFLVISNYSFSQWIKLNNNSFYSILKTGNNMFAAVESGVLLSTDNGLTWTNAGLNNYHVNTLAVNDNKIYAGSNYGGIFLSTDNGTTWVTKNNGLTYWYISDIVIGENDMYVSESYGGVFRSTDAGDSWFAVNNGLPSLYITALAIHNNYVFTGTSGNGDRLFRSSNNGELWSPVMGGQVTVGTVEFNGNHTFAGTYSSGVFRSSDNGSSWLQINNGLNYYAVHDLEFSGSMIFAGTVGDNPPYVKAYYSTDNGQNWIDWSEGLFGLLFLNLLIVDDEYIYGGTRGGIWKRSISEITSVSHNHQEIPQIFRLYQNYPNPFNPETNINYDLSHNSFVRLTIFNILGKEITTLVNEYQKAGKYGVSFDGGGLSSGVYFVKLVANDFSDTKKIILMK